MAKEYIERNELLKWAREFYNEEKVFASKVFASAVINAPTADVQEVRHGKWLPTSHPDQKRCSVCDVISFIALYPCINKADYCPHCGAKMDKEQE